MTGTRTLQVSTPSDREVRMVRVFDAPRRLVFDALTKPELLKRWFYGPPGWSLAVCQPALHVGDRYRYVWHGPGGIEMGIGGICQEFVPPEKMVATEKFDTPWYPGEAVVTQTLMEEGGKTTLTLTVRYESKEARDIAIQTPMTDGVSMGYDRLAEVLASLKGAA